MLALKDEDRIQGPVSAALLVIFYGSYPCPKSIAAHRTVKAIQSALGDQLCLVFRHFPTQQHPRAQIAAETAEAAGSQGKFWQMHDRLLAQSQKLDDASLVELACDVGLNISQFLYEITQHVHTERIQADKDSGLHCGVEQTPTFFISIRNRDSENLARIIEQILTVALHA